jgi:multimeric flavodoxin WrbA
MKIIGISGSPRRGNTEWMLKTLLDEAAGNGAEVEMILLRRMNLHLCLGCLTCEEGGKDRKGICKINDDMNATYPKLLAADAIVLATPGYFEMLSGLLKNFLDRTCAIWPKLESKKIAGLAVAEEGIGQTIRNLKTYGSLCNMSWVGSVATLAKNPGDASKDKNLEKRVRRLGRKLVESE